MISRDSVHNWILSLLLVVATGATVRADWDDRFVAALRDRQLWSLGEAFCKEQMQAAKSPREAARWSVEGMRTAAAAALHQTGTAADDAWNGPPLLAIRALLSRPASGNTSQEYSGV